MARELRESVTPGADPTPPTIAPCSFVASPIYARRMNRRQRNRRRGRRVAHKPDPEEPPVLPQQTFQKVQKGHIIPAVYQRNFAVDQQVSVHFAGRPECEIRNVKTAGTRGPFYRRTRPDGQSIDDIEASLSVLESTVQPAFVALCRGEALNLERKAVLAQFFGMQMVRGPAFFAERGELLADLIAQLKPTDFKSQAVAEAGGDVELVRGRVLEPQLASSSSFIRMLSLGVKMGSVLGSMRWHLLDFGAPLLAYSDHPVVVWPADVVVTEPFDTPRLGPLGAIEIRVPLSAQISILMTWADVPDKGTVVEADARFAGELNAFVIAQADEQWMHRPGDEPPVSHGRFTPLSRNFELSYTPAALAASQRRAFAAAYLHRVRTKQFLTSIEIAQLNWTREG